MIALLNWFRWLGQFLVFWLQESFKEAVKFGTSFWGLALIVASLAWTVVSNIVPLLTLTLSTLNSIATGTWNLAPSSTLTVVLNTANTFVPLQELCAAIVTYGALLGALNLYRFVKNLIWGMPGD